MKSKTLTVALVGNPNTGKSTLFNALTGMRQHVGNYPGVTVELKKGQTSLDGTYIDIIDLPGTYSLAARSLDEMVTVDLLLGHRPEEPRPGAIISIVDASNLERHLYLTTQLMEMGVPVILAVNLIDVAEKHGLKIDYDRLGKQLGMRVVPIQANRSRGLDELKKAVAESIAAGEKPSGPAFPEPFRIEVQSFAQSLGTISPFLVERMLLDIGGYTQQQLTKQFGSSLEARVEEARKRLALQGCTIPAVEAKTRYTWIRQTIAGCIVKPAQKKTTSSDRFDRVLTHKFWGTLVFLALMFLVFEAIFVGATPLMQLIDSAKEWLAELVRDAMSVGPLRSLITDGIFKGVGGVLQFLPQIMILFGFIAILEDCGYMARAAFLMDKVMSKCGLNGKSFIPLLSSVACAVPGIMATRVIENRRDRLATILVAPLMSCSARLPLYMLLIAVFLPDPWWLQGVALFGMYLLGLVVAPLVALTLKRTLLRGDAPIFVLEMPAFKWPQLKTILRRMVSAGKAFVVRAGTLILASMILIWALLYFPTTIPEGEFAGQSYDKVTADLQAEIEKQQKQKLSESKKEGEAEASNEEDEKSPEEAKLHKLYADWKGQSLLGQTGKGMEPVFAPLGWDWKIGMAALASFPAREVVVGTMGIIYNEGDVDPKSIRESLNPGNTPLGKTIHREWSNDPVRGKYRVPVALSLMVFFALCCQCASTLAVIRRETGSWSWPAFTFVYMTVLAYVGGLIVYQIGKLIVG
jgi:ferrous iron transport protein B